jgi:hypothetical protein
MACIRHVHRGRPPQITVTTENEDPHVAGGYTPRPTSPGRLCVWIPRWPRS